MWQPLDAAARPGWQCHQHLRSWPPRLAAALASAARLFLRDGNGAARDRLGREETRVVVVVGEDLGGDRDLLFEAAEALVDRDQVDDRGPRVHQEAERIR